VSVSENSGAFSPIVQDTADTSVRFTGRLGSSYSFYSVAVDNPGNEERKDSADGTTWFGAVDADFNRDCCVNQQDYDILTADVRSAGAHDPRFDINGDGGVNRADARTLLGFYSNPGCASSGGSGGTTTPATGCGLGWELVGVVVLLRMLAASRERGLRCHFPQS
jgi:hypothetical protein